MIKKIGDKEKKEEICMEILEALPEWFEMPESRVSYAKESREFPFWADMENNIARGFVVLKEMVFGSWSAWKGCGMKRIHVRYM